jgi:hypothetical protein
MIRLSACDPLNLVGIVTPGPRAQATLAGTVTYRDGVPASAEMAKVVQAPRPDVWGAAVDLG